MLIDRRHSASPGEQAARRDLCLQTIWKRIDENLIMLRTIGAICTALLLALQASAEAAKQVAFNGAQGTFGFARACNGEFPGSRMRTIVEVLRTTALPPLDNFDTLPHASWASVQPIFEGFKNGVSNGVALDASGAIDFPWLLNCLSHESASYRGFVVNGNGVINTSGCDSVYHVSCCAPVP
jgi:hypothetical protein